MEDPLFNLLLGFVFGTISSLLAALAWDRWTRPRLAIEIDRTKAVGQNAANPPHEFFHVVVGNRREDPAEDGLAPGLRTAWSCSATLEILPNGTSPKIGPISARWTSQPEPIQLLTVGQMVYSMVDIARIIAGRRVDVHSHREQQLSIVLKFEGEDDCFLFTNESYAFLPKWNNPAWRLGLGRHHLRVTIDFELGRKQADFWIENGGRRREDVRLLPFEAR